MHLIIFKNSTQITRIRRICTDLNFQKKPLPALRLIELCHFDEKNKGMRHRHSPCKGQSINNSD